MIVLKVDARSPDPEAIRTAADAIRRGELVVFPTETVYGLAADALNESAVKRVLEVKGRCGTLPLPVQVASVDDLPKVASSVSETVRLLAARFWPGPLTLVLPKSSAISSLVSAGAETVGVRIPDHAVALALLRELGSPIVATSANITGEPPALRAESAIEKLGEAVSVVLDAGESVLKVSSTVLDASVSPPRILRPGAISAEEIRQSVGEVNVYTQ